MANADQRRVLGGVAAAVIGTGTAFALGYAFLGALHPANDDVASRWLAENIPGLGGRLLAAAVRVRESELDGHRRAEER